MTQPLPSVRWPAEWEPQDALWLSWPHNRETWPGLYEPVPKAFTALARQIALATPVRVLAGSKVAGEAERALDGIANLELVDVETNDCWIRDYGPTFVQAADGSLAGVDWRYNSWGGKYPPWDRDAAAAEKILKQIGVNRIPSTLCLEGGAIETDGAGRLLLTPDCVLTETRNPGCDKAQVEAELSEKLGVREFIWLTGGGLIGDDTDGHIDQLARFVDPENLVIASCEPSDPNYPALEANYQQLQRWAEQADGNFQVHRLPIPSPREVDGQRVPECYCNFLISGAQVLVPTFADPKSDRLAVAIVRNLMPQHDVVPLDASALSWGLGAFHCMSQQQPSPHVSN
ncbi:agmatine deiminase family protein [Rosistilla ulvae]|nr:agmatine deiminase family protein [Rosistilla ulvae]